MNSSQTSLPAQESAHQDSTTQSVRSNTMTSGSGAPGSTQGGVQPQAGPTSLSGLVCNVHRTTGREPHALVGATTTILGDKLYVFGGKILSRSRPQLTADLYELDLIRRHWTKVDTTGDIPPPRYFHSVCALGDTKLVCYGGMSPISVPSNLSTSSITNSDPQPEVVVMSDIHIYDVPSRTWTHVQTSENPQGRYAHCASIIPSTAIFTSPDAPRAAIHNNPSSSNPHQGQIGVGFDGTGGAEMVVVGGQDSSNHYIEQISVFNLRSLKWTTTTPFNRQCGAYRSIVAPLVGTPISQVGVNSADPTVDISPDDDHAGMLIYSNYNFLDVKLELHIRLPDGRLVDKTMPGPVSPPGLRFPSGGVINHHFVVCGTYITSSKQEYALWALDLRSLTWGRIDAGGSVFNHGSWNRGTLWNRRNTFVILGNRKRSLVDDYNHRRTNFSHVCMVELEAFGLYDNPRKVSPTSGYVSVSSPPIPASIHPKLASQIGGGRPYTTAAERLGQAALTLRELSDMDLLALGGERVPVNSHLLARRWGPYFTNLLKESTASHDTISDAATLRPQMLSQASRNSSITITPSIDGAGSTYSAATTLTVSNGGTMNSANASTLPGSFEPPNIQNLPPSSRPRTLYLPHTHQTILLLVRFIYTSSLPPITSPLCTPQALCSLLQLARPYQVDGLLEATVERLHEVLDGRNAAAVFNAAAMAAGGGRGTGMNSGSGGTLQILNEQHQMMDPTIDSDGSVQSLSAKAAGLRINTSITSSSSGVRINAHEKNDSIDSASTTTSMSSNTDYSATTKSDSELGGGRNRERPVWTGDVSSVVGLQKRGLRGLMEGRRLRERGATVGTGAAGGVPGAGNGSHGGGPSGSTGLGTITAAATGA